MRCSNVEFNVAFEIRELLVAFHVTFDFTSHL